MRVRIALSWILAVLQLFAVEGCVHQGGFQYPCCANLNYSMSLESYESEFMTIPSAARARKNLQHYASVAHIAGTKEDYDMAQWTKKEFLSYGLKDVVVHEMSTSLNYPVSRHLKLKRKDKVVYQAPLSEDCIEEDKDSDTPWRNLSFNGFSPSGEVLAKAVYANYGSPEDFAQLDKENISVKGRIAIVRYGKCFRGIKVMNAQKAGATGVLIYSDPQDDGYDLGKTYPDGPWRPESSVQRGSVQFLSLCAGDPSRTASDKTVEEVCGFKREELIPSIPVIPVSYGDIQPILENLQGPEVIDSFKGGLKITYRYGPSKDTVDLMVNNKFVVTPIWNVIATIKGTLPESEDQPILIGNHRDAWVYGAADPNSGSAIMLEVGRGLAHLLTKTDWRPKRTIILSSWSGEEYGLIGSTGWAEQYADTILKRAVTYLNVDVGVSGSKFKVGASPSLGSAVSKVLSKVTDPQTSKPLVHRWDKQIGTLGSGSDFTVFLDNLGIASLDMRFVPDNVSAQYGVYHSIYDSFHWVATEADPTFEYHKTLAIVWGMLVLELSTPDVLGLSPVDQALALDAYVRGFAGKEQGVDFKSLQIAVRRFTLAARKLSEQLLACRGDCGELNERNGFLERQFLHSKGLPGRRWFKSILQSPSYYLGYGADVLPGITEALHRGDPQLAQQQVDIAVRLVNKATAWLVKGRNPPLVETTM